MALPPANEPPRDGPKRVDSAPRPSLRGVGRVLAEAVGIVLAGALVGGALNQLSARPVALDKAVFSAAASGTALCGGGGAGGAEAGGEMISQSDAAAACNACTAGFVDARGAAAYAEGHLPGAIHLPPMDASNESALLEPLRKFSSLVVYDQGGQDGASGAACPLAAGVAQRLRAAGFPEVRVLDGGWAAWQKNAGPAESGACASCAQSGAQSGQAEASIAGASAVPPPAGNRDHDAPAGAPSRAPGRASGSGARP